MTSNDTPPAPPSPTSRWTPVAVFGLLALIAGWVLRLVYEVEPEAASMLSPQQLAAALAEARTGLRVGDGLLLLGGSLLGWSPPLPSLRGGSSGGGIGTGLSVGLVLGTGALVAGCAGGTVRADRAWAELADHPNEPPPACKLTLYVDGEQAGPTIYARRCEKP